MKVLAVGAGVIGTVYGAHLGAAGHAVDVLSHPPRTDQIAARGLAARDVLDGSRAGTTARVVSSVGADAMTWFLSPSEVTSQPGHAASSPGWVVRPRCCSAGTTPAAGPRCRPHPVGVVRLGFPRVGGVLRDGTADYVRIRQQPTALEAGSDPRLAELARALRSRGFAVQRVADIDGWLAYHAAFIACIAPALYQGHVVSVRAGRSKVLVQ
jgi:2-dehydropantoate 2-reductase